jgi:hypothetical protein
VPDGRRGREVANLGEALQWAARASAEVGTD